MAPEERSQDSSGLDATNKHPGQSPFTARIICLVTIVVVILLDIFGRARNISLVTPDKNRRAILLLVIGIVREP